MPEIIPQKLQDSEENYLKTTFWEIYPLFLLVRDGDSDRLKESLDIELEKFPIGRITRDRKTQLEFLTVCLVNTFMIAAIEGAERRPSPDMAQRIGAVLGFPWTLFFEGDGAMDAETDDTES